MADYQFVVDIVGVGLNATDTISGSRISLPSIPRWNFAFLKFSGRPGGYGGHGLRAMGFNGAVRRKDRRRSCRAASAERDA